MKISNIATLVVGIILVQFFGCGQKIQESPNQALLTKTKKSSNEKIEAFSADFLGNYHGIQPSYFIKNQYGDDMVINGQKVSIPSIDFKFLVKEDGAVSLQQTNLEDNGRVYYDGTIKIIKDDTDILKIECSLSDGKSSNPIYILAINKSDKTVICYGNSEPEFKLEKIK